MGQRPSEPAKPPPPPPIPNPGKFDDIHREAKMVMPETFEGFRCEFSKQFGEQGADLLATHILSVGTPQPELQMAGPGQRPQKKQGTPESYMFAAQYTGERTSAVGRFDGRTGSVFATLSYSPLPLLKAVLQAHVQPSGELEAACEADVRRATSVTQLKAQSSGVYVASHMHGITPEWAVGAEALLAQRNGYRSHVVGARWTRGMSVLAATLAAQARELLVTHAHRVNSCLVAVAELRVGQAADGSGEAESVATVGWQYSTPLTVVRGRVNSRLEVGATVDEPVGALRVSLSADADLRNSAYKWGFGVAFQ